VTRLTTTLVLAASIGASAALYLPGEAPAASTGGTAAHRTASARCVSSAARAHRARASKKSSCAASTRLTASTRPASPRRNTNARPLPKKPRSASSGRSQTPPVQAGVTKAVTIAKVIPPPCQNTNLTPEPANLPLVRAAVLCLINEERAQNGREPLVLNTHLEEAAESHGREMIADNYFAHVSPAGLTPVDRVRRAGYIPSSEVGYVIGENLAWGTLTLSTPAAIVNAWINSPEHLANILEGSYRETGIDVEPEAPESLAEGTQGALYTQEFGVITH
jgi:uncharacterized protein YkwD